MNRPILAPEHIHTRIQDPIASKHQDIILEVQAAAASNKVLVVGMAQNPFPRKARKLLDEAGIDYKYLQYGSYFSDWRRRTALKMWTGWHTFPMIFIKGMLIGGADDLKALMENGELKQLLA